MVDVKYRGLQPMERKALELVGLLISERPGVQDFTVVVSFSDGTQVSCSTKAGEIEMVRG